MYTQDMKMYGVVLRFGGECNYQLWFRWMVSCRGGSLFRWGVVNERRSMASLLRTLHYRKLVILNPEQTLTFTKPFEDYRWIIEFIETMIMLSGGVLRGSRREILPSKFVEDEYENNMLMELNMRFNDLELYCRYSNRVKEESKRLMILNLMIERLLKALSPFVVAFANKNREIC
ncbi:hypothetical protein LXL04_004506 [Taraxacum kok-saghyz]